jgi:hypothetical protein
MHCGNCHEWCCMTRASIVYRVTKCSSCGALREWLWKAKGENGNHCCHRCCARSDLLRDMWYYCLDLKKIYQSHSVLCACLEKISLLKEESSFLRKKTVGPFLVHTLITLNIFKTNQDQSKSANFKFDFYHISAY